jgi:SAM-dependent methyltransferase
VAALSAQALGNGLLSLAHLGAIPASERSAAMNSLDSFVRQTLTAQEQLPEVLTARDGEYFEGKTALRIGGRVRLLDRWLDRCAEVIDLNATETRFGASNHASVIGDAHDLRHLADQSVDVVASSHTIEHLVNPLLALREWRRVLKPGGYLYSSVPNHVHTFDHRRTVTTLEHLIEDLQSGNVAVDWLHVCEFLRNHDCERDLVFKGDKKRHFGEFMQAPHLRTHYHVFDLPLVYVMHQYAGFDTLSCFESDISVHWLGRRPAAAH